MSIVVQCPHCETRFNLQAEMNGKSMRCPNLECRQVFTVHAQEATAPPPPVPEPPPPPPKRQAPAPPRPTKPVGAKPPKPGAPPPPKPEVVDAEIVDAAVVAPPKVKQVVWSEGTEAPGAKKGRKPLKPEVVEDPDPLVRRKKARNRRPLILAILAVGTLALVGFVALYLLRSETRKEEQLAKQAEEAYSKGEYATAARQYEKLAAEYAGSSDGEKYKFFADLSAMRDTVQSVTNVEDYTPALKRLNEFVAAHQGSPLAKPNSGYGRDVLAAGKKLGEDIATFAEKRVEAFRSDRTKPAELERAKAAIAAGRELVKQLAPFRGQDDSFDTVNAALDKAEQTVKREGERRESLAAAKEQLENPTYPVIESVETALAAAGFLQDAEAKKLVDEAKAKLRALVKYEADPAAPQPPPPNAATSLLFVAPVGKDNLHDRTPAQPPPAVFLCVARGILYALDEDNGSLLWAARVGPDVTDPPAVAHVALDIGPTDLAVVTANVGNAPAVFGYVLKSGVARWYQPLPAPAAGPAVVVGTRAFIPLKDALGTIYEFDLTTGARIGRIRLGQSVATRGAVMRPGTSLMYVAADARRLYLIDVGGSTDGNRVDPRCVQVLATDHLPGTLRVPPMFVGPAGTDPAERWLFLAQTDDRPSATKIRAFPIGPLPAPAADGGPPAETRAVSAASQLIPGWVWFPPVVNAERIAAVSDTGQFRIFGVNQAGNADSTLFPIPGPTLPPVATDRTSPGLIISVSEGTYWLLAAGQLQKAILTLIPSKRQEVVLDGKPLAIGEPIHPAQIGSHKDTACLVVRVPHSSGCRAIAFDLKDGAIRWQRQLGLVPAAAPIRQGNHFVVADEGGVVVSVPTTTMLAAGKVHPAPAEWRLASAPPNATGPTVVAVSPDGKVAYTVTPIVVREIPKFLVRRIVDGKIVRTNPKDPAGDKEPGEELVAPAAVGGQPAVIGDSLLIPATDGFVYRRVPGTNETNPTRLEPGPKWWGERKPADPVCTIIPLSDVAFATSDGGKTLTRWTWAAGFAKAGEWELDERVAGAGVVMPPAEAGGPPRLMVADITGGVWLFAANRDGQPLRRWRTGGGSVIPAGRPSSAFVAQLTDPTRVTVAYVVDGNTAAAIDPERDEPLWAARTGDGVGGVIVGAPQPAGGNRWVVTDLAGRVVVRDGITGHAVATRSVGLPGAVPATASGVAATTALTPLSDGSAVLVELPKKE